MQLLAMTACIALLATGCGTGQKKLGKDSQTLVHNVYFTLIDASDEKKAEMINDCYTYLEDHPGIVYFSAGTVSPEHSRPVNVKDFDVSLHMVFDSIAAHDAYQISEDHQTFIKRTKGNRKKLRVFDSLIK